MELLGALQGALVRLEGNRSVVLTRSLSLHRPRLRGSRAFLEVNEAKDRD